MADTAKPPQKPAGKKSPLGVRIALFVTLALVIIVAVRWLGLKGDLKRGQDLYEAGKYQEAADVLQPLMQKPLARLKIRAEAKKTLGLCKAEIASDIAMKERSAEGYRKALNLLGEARALAGPTPEIERRIKEYSEYLDRAEHPAALPSAPPTSPAIPPAPVAPPAIPPATSPTAPIAPPVAPK